ncbi:HPr family phosphocarrier protein [Oscillospiraceae bacterium PP1C4]
MIIKEVMLHSAEDLRQFMYLAMQSSEEIGVHTTDGKIADAKSVLGLMALDYNKPVKVVTEDSRFIKQIDKWIVEA